MANIAAINSMEMKTIRNSNKKHLFILLLVQIFQQRFMWPIFYGLKNCWRILTFRLRISTEVIGVTFLDSCPFSKKFDSNSYSALTENFHSDSCLHFRIPENLKWRYILPHEAKDTDETILPLPIWGSYVMVLVLASSWVSGFLFTLHYCR